MLTHSHWYLVRTKPKKEHYVSAQLMHIAPEVFLPLLSTAPRLSDATKPIAPLFPRYVFLRCDLAIDYFQIRYAPGVLSFVAAGPDPLPVPESIIESIRARCTDGVVYLIPKPFREGEPVRILAGPFRGFDAVFERYLSGADRVAILLNAIQGFNPRLIASAASITR
ncbi:MAG: transcription termination/antitermination protein NusG [Candidatus Binataceae bacterium]